MRNVTVTIDDETARWARMEAARREVSVSRLIRDLLQEHMKRQEVYRAAMDRFLARKPRPLKKRGRYPGREELHDRAGLR